MDLPAVFSLCVLLWSVILIVFVGRQSKRAGVIGAVAIVSFAGISYGLAVAGVLDNYTLPPPLFFLLFATLTLTALLARSSPLPKTLTWVVGLQTFRVIVELLIHEAVAQKIAPPQLTWTGLNFDILTGLSAPVVAVLIASGHADRLVVKLWNIAGLFLLFWVVAVAILSLPLPFQVWQPDNTWVAHAPYIWLPVIFVASALYLHILTFRMLSSGNGDR